MMPWSSMPFANVLPTPFGSSSRSHAAWLSGFVSRKPCVAPAPAR
jgi:hypothetical protein